MKIDFYNRQRRYSLDLDEFERDCEALAPKLAELLKAKAPRTSEYDLSRTKISKIFAESTVTVVLLSDAAIRRLNRDFRSIDRATDVLSFPIEIDAPPVVTGEEWILGELYISVEKAAGQAVDYGHSLRRELVFLFTHGLLHLLGFDHMEKAGEKEMFAYQNAALDAIGIGR